MNLAMKVVQRVVGVQAHIIAKNFPKQSAVQIVMVGGVLDLNQMNVVIHFVLEAVLEVGKKCDYYRGMVQVHVV